MKAKTLSSQQVWQSPDGKRTIWKVQLEADGNQYGLETFSEEIAKEGFEGDVETYDKNGKKFVKQPQTEGGYRGGGGATNAARLEQDKAKQKEIRAEWAIAKAIQALQIFPLDEKALNQVQGLASKLYVMVDSVIEVSGEKGTN